jgi:hypothetical protein
MNNTHGGNYGRMQEMPEYEYDDMFKAKQNNISIKKDFFQAIGNVFGATNQHAA